MRLVPGAFAVCSVFLHWLIRITRKCWWTLIGRWGGGGCGGCGVCWTFLVLAAEHLGWGGLDLSQLILSSFVGYFNLNQTLL